MDQKNPCISANIIPRMQATSFRHVCVIDVMQVEAGKETESDNWQHNKPKGQHLT